MQTSYFSLGKPISEITTQNSTPSKNNAYRSMAMKKKVQAKKTQSKFSALDFSNGQLKTPSTPSLKGQPHTPSIHSSTPKKKINRKLPVPRPEPSICSKITETIQQLSEDHRDVNDFLLLNANVNKHASAEIREANKMFAKLLARLPNLPESRNCSNTKSGATREDRTQILEAEKKFQAMNSVSFEDPAMQLQKMMAAARQLAEEREMIDQESEESEFESERPNCAVICEKNVISDSPGIRKKIKKFEPQSAKKSLKSNALARRSTFETSRENFASSDYFLHNDSEISLGYSQYAFEGEVNKNVPLKNQHVPTPIIKDSETPNAQQAQPKTKKAKKQVALRVETNSMFGFSEAPANFEDIQDGNADKKNWDKFGFLFCQSDDSDSFSADNDAFHCDFNIRQPFVHTSNVVANEYEHMNASNVVAVAKDEDFAGWLERPCSYGPMSLTYSDCGNFSPCLGLEHGGFEERMEFR